MVEIQRAVLELEVVVALATSQRHRSGRVRLGIRGLARSAQGDAAGNHAARRLSVRDRGRDANRQRRNRCREHHLALAPITHVSNPFCYVGSRSQQNGLNRPLSGVISQTHDAPPSTLGPSARGLECGFRMAPRGHPREPCIGKTWRHASAQPQNTADANTDSYHLLLALN